MLVAMAVSIVAEPAEWALYDARVPLRRDPGWAADLVHVPITEKDLVALGGWPLPSASLVALIRQLEEAGAKTVVLDMFLGTAGSAEDEAALASVLGRTVTAITFDARNGRAPTSDEIRAAMIPAARGEGPVVDPASLAFPPEPIVSAAARLGHAGFVESGVIRSSPPLVRVTGFENALPSQALAALLVHRAIDPASVEWTPTSIRLPGRSAVPLRDGETLLDLTAGSPETVSVPDLLNERLGRRSLQGALAVVHVDTPEDRHRSALGDETPGGLLLASAIRTLDTGRQPRFFPAWAAVLIAASAMAAALRVPRRQKRLITCAAAEAAWLAGAFALVPIADVFLPILPALVVFAAGIAAAALGSPVSDSASGSAGPVAPS